MDYIFKPFDPFILKSKVNIFVDLFEKNLEIKRQATLLRQIELQEKERQISEIRQESDRSYAHLADAVPHSIIKVKPSGEVEYFNQQWLEYTGFKSEIDWELIVHPKDRRKFSVLWLRMCHQNRQIYEEEIRLRSTRDGIYRWHLVRAVPDIKDGENICWIASCTDIDNIKKTEESLRSCLSNSIDPIKNWKNMPMWRPMTLKSRCMWCLPLFIFLKNVFNPNWMIMKNNICNILKKV